MAKVLVVDDEPLNRELLVELLAAEGMEVAEAASGEEALRRLAQEGAEIGAVLLDVRMPHLDGYEVCQRIKSEPATCLLPVILVTAMEDRSSRIRGLEAGADDFLTKPVDAAELIPRVRTALRTHEAVQALDMAMEVAATLSSVLEARDPYTHDHAQRVATYAVRLGEAMGLPHARLRVLYLGCLLHDVGKVGVPDSILLKPGPLTDAEYASIKTHPETGARLCAPIRGLEEVAEVILCHHERWDGRGYPRGLAGAAIPLLARIAAVADAYDAMTSNRPYRQAMGDAQARAEIRRHRGRQFDPEVVDLFLGLSFGQPPIPAAQHVLVYRRIPPSPFRPG